MKIMRWITILTIAACWAVSTYAQDGGVGNKIPSTKTQEMTSPNFNLTAVPCTYNSMGVSTDSDCNVFAGQEVQEYFAGYDQFGVPMNSYQVTLDFGPGNPAGTTVGCSPQNIGPGFTVANCLVGTGVPVPTGGGPVVLTFGESFTGIGVTCVDSSTGSDAPNDGGAANAACLNYSVNAINQDIKTGGAAGLPFVYYYPPAGITGMTPTVQTSGPCTIPPSNPPPLGGIPASPFLVCGPNSFVLGIGISCISPGGPNCSGSGEGTFDPASLPTIAFVQADPSLGLPEPPTLLLVGAAMFGMSILLMKKKAISA